MAFKQKGKIKEVEKKGFFKTLKNIFSTETIKQVMSRSYKASKQSNGNYYWSRQTTTEDYDIYTGLEALRARSRNLAQNNPIMKHYLLMLDNNIIGKDGMKLQVLGKDGNNKLDLNGNLAVGKAWKDWTRKENCDASGKNNLRNLLSIVMKSLAKDGECLVRFVREETSKKNKYGFKIQLLDVERLDILLNKELEDGFIRFGVEVDNSGNPRAYWLRKFNVKDNSQMSGTLITNDYERVDVNDLKHIFLQENPEQTRGVPFAHSVMIYMEDLDDFNQACLLAAKVGAASSIYLERTNGTKTSDFADYEEDGDYVQEMGFGEIRTLPVGTSMKSFEGKYPSDAYQIYTKRLLQQIAGGVGLSQIFLGNDTSDLNYSSARTIIMEERNYYMLMQEFLIDNLLDVMYEQWLGQALLNKQIFYVNGGRTISTIGADKFDKFKEHAFIGRRWEGIDPAKEEDATTTAYQQLRKPLSVILAERGLDLADTMNQYKQDREIIDSILGKDFNLAFGNTEPGNNNGNNNTNNNNSGNGSDTNATNNNTTTNS